MVPLFEKLEKKESPRRALFRLAAPDPESSGDRAARWLLATSWTKFFAIVASFYLLTALLIAAVFQLSGGLHESQRASFADAFAVSLQALTVFGSGRLIALTPLAKGITASAMFIGWLALLFILAMTMVRFIRLRPHFRSATFRLEEVAEEPAEKLAPPGRVQAPN